MSEPSQELLEFHRLAAHAIAQRQMMFALLDLPRDISDAGLLDQLRARIAAEKRIRLAAGELLKTAAPEVETAGRTWRVDAQHLAELRRSLEQPATRDPLPTE